MEKTEIEKSIIKKFKKDIWSKFIKAIKDFHLIEDSDVIAVCISGGKDSMLMAKCLEEFKQHKTVNFDLKYIIMDPGYNEENMAKIKENSTKLNLDPVIFKSDIFKVTDKIAHDNPCYLCARMRRGYLYDQAKKLGCNKIALGHHLDDVVETIVMNLMFNGQYSSMMPKLKSKNFEGMELIRPLYYVKEEIIIKWAKYNSLDFIDCACYMTKKDLGKRREIKELIKELNQKYQDVDLSIFKSSMNVNLNTVIKYSDDESHSFLDKY